MLWNVPFEKQTQYFENLFSVVAGLVQSALVRTLRHLSLAADEFYIAGTHILTDGAFRSVLGVYQTIRKRRTGQFLLVQVVDDRELAPQQYDEKIGRWLASTRMLKQPTMQPQPSRSCSARFSWSCNKLRWRLSATQTTPQPVQPTSIC